jgi:hypothetical protein
MSWKPLINQNPAFENAEAYFTHRKNNEIVGRIAAINWVEVNDQKKRKQNSFWLV